MSWIARHVALRENPERLLPGCKTVLTLAYPYSADIPTTAEGLRAARYTEGLNEDYHLRLKRLGREIENLISHLFPGSKSRICVDSAPLMERSLAFASGLGFFGKNNMVIIPGYGSYFYLAEILTTAFIPHQKPKPLESQCGTCTRCLDACPTRALERPYRHNPGNCLSYLTVEYKGPLRQDTGKLMGGCFFGCDICQEVCPFNKRKGMTSTSLPSAKEILDMDEPGFRRTFGKTAFARAGLIKIKQDIRAALLK